MHQLRAGPEDAGDGIDPVAQGRIHQVGIALGRLHLRVAQQLADHFQRGATADQQGREGVAQVVDPDIGQFGLGLDPDPEPADFLDRLAGRVAGEQPRIAAWHQQGRWRTMAATSPEIGMRWILRCLVVAAGFDQLPRSRLNCSNRACAPRPTARRSACRAG
jgi:hypothetical protein